MASKPKAPALPETAACPVCRLCGLIAVPCPRCGYEHQQEPKSV